MVHTLFLVLYFCVCISGCLFCYCLFPVVFVNFWLSYFGCQSLVVYFRLFVFVIYVSLSFSTSVPKGCHSLSISLCVLVSLYPYHLSDSVVFLRKLNIRSAGQSIRSAQSSLHTLLWAPVWHSQFCARTWRCRTWSVLVAFPCRFAIAAASLF